MVETLNKNIAREELNHFITWCQDQGVLLVRSDPEVMKNCQMTLVQKEDLVTQYYENFSLRSHPHVQFSVVDEESETIYSTFSEASDFATKLSIKSKSPITVEVVVYSKEGAIWYSGKTAGKSFVYDKNGCVFERIIITAKSKLG